MSFLGWVVGIGAVGFLLKAGKETREAREIEEQRKNTRCSFLNGISVNEFKSMAIRSGKGIKRISKVSVEGPIVYGTVQSLSGKSEWHFKIDYNDFGHVTGRYLLSTDHEDSNIPNRLAEIIRSSIMNYDVSSASSSRIEEADDAFTESQGQRNYSNSEFRSSTSFVPCSFSDGISKYEFHQIVKIAVKKNDRIEELKIFDAKVYGLIRSQSGKTAWRFVLDFNDNGHLTGYYRNLTNNEDSRISFYIGEAIKEEILHRLVRTGVN